MSETRYRLPAVLLAASLALVSRPGLAQEREQPATQDRSLVAPSFDIAELGRKVYEQRCKNCHATKPGIRSIAPSLFGIVGRRAGSAEGYKYSPKLAGSNLVWTAQSLNAWLAVSTIATPDLRLRHAGINDAIQRGAVVAYLASLKK